jgi:DNA mismatch endonuclease, patch repair protein
VEKYLKGKLPNGRFLNVPITRSRAMAAIRGKHTKSTEVSFRMLLVRSKVAGWRLHAADLPGKPDLFFPELKLAIFVDGCFWHGCPRCGHIPKTRRAFWLAKITRNRRRDQVNARSLRNKGVSVIRIWEHALQDDQSVVRILRKIARYSAAGRGPTFRLR